MNKRPLIQIFKEDDILINSGESCAEMYKILSGNVALYLHYGEKDEYLLGVVGEQKCLGEVSLLTGKPSPYTVVAVNDVTVMRIGAQDFESFIANNPKNAADIMKNMANSIVLLNTNIDMICEELADKTKEDKTGKNLIEKIKQYKTYDMTYYTAKFTDKA